MPNCKEHADCDLVCSVCGSYYCQYGHEGFHWIHVRRPDMPDDIEDYRNERAERLFGRHERP